MLEILNYLYFYINKFIHSIGKFGLGFTQPNSIQNINNKTSNLPMEIRKGINDKKGK